MPVGLDDLWLLVGLCVALLLRRSPHLALGLGALAGWAVFGVVDGVGLSVRGYGVLAAALAVMSGRSEHRAVWAVAAVGAAGLTVAAWSGSALERGLGFALLVGVSVGAGELLSRVRAPGVPAVFLVAGLVGTVLTMLTGSVRVAEESVRSWLPVVALLGVVLDARALRAGAFLLVFAWGQGVIWSDLSVWAAVPLAMLGAAALARRSRWAAVAGAVLLGVLGSSWVVWDWMTNPPF